jgi:hypothetical protein
MTTKQILIIGGVALGAIIVYKYVINKPATSAHQPTTTPTNVGTQGNQQGAPGTTGNGIVDLGLNLLNTGEGLYNKVFGNTSSGNSTANG